VLVMALVLVMLVLVLVVLMVLVLVKVGVPVLNQTVVSRWKPTQMTGLVLVTAPRNEKLAVRIGKRMRCGRSCGGRSWKRSSWPQRWPLRR